MSTDTRLPTAIWHPIAAMVKGTTSPTQRVWPVKRVRPAVRIVVSITRAVAFLEAPTRAGAGARPVVEALNDRAQDGARPARS